MKKRLYLIAILIICLIFNVKAMDGAKSDDMGAEICVNLIAKNDTRDTDNSFIKYEQLPSQLVVHCIKGCLESDIQGARASVIKQSGRYHILLGQNGGFVSKHDPMEFGVDVGGLDNLCNAVKLCPEGVDLYNDRVWETIHESQRDPTQVYVTVRNKTLRQSSSGYNVYDFLGKFQNNPNWRDSIANMELIDLDADFELVCIYDGQTKGLVSIPDMGKKEIFYFPLDCLRGDLKFQLSQHDMDGERLHGDCKYPIEMKNGRYAFSVFHHFTITIHDDSDYGINVDRIFTYQPPSKIYLEITNGTMREDLTVLHDWVKRAWVNNKITQKGQLASEDLVLFSVVLFKYYPPLRIEIDKEFNKTYGELKDLGFEIFVA